MYSIFLAKFLGLLFLFMGIAVLIKKDSFNKIAYEAMQNKTLIFFSGFISFVGGLLILLFHHTWEASWAVLITIIGYLFVLQGIARVYFTDYVVEHAHKWFKGNAPIYFGIIALIVGLFLTYEGFWGAGRLGY